MVTHTRRLALIKKRSVLIGYVYISTEEREVHHLRRCTPLLMRMEPTPVTTQPPQSGRGRFPNPVVNTSCIFSSDVESDDGVTELKNVLSSASDVCYEFSIVIKKSIFGLVVRANVLQPTMNETYRRTGQQVAIKVCAKDVLMRNGSVSLENPIVEIAAMQDMGDPRHPNLAHQFECCVDEKNIYSILKFQPGVELFDHILNCGPLNELSARCMFQQLMLALFRLQQRDISHRDISLENIMFDARNHGTVLIDFGLCVKLQRDPQSGSIIEIPNTACGKGYYMSPESAWDGRSQLVNPLQGDVWSAGMCLLYALLGFPPIERACDDDVRYNYLTQGRLCELLDHWDVRLSAEVVDLIELILRPEPADRPSVQQIWQHRWMQSEGLPCPFAAEVTSAEVAALCGHHQQQQQETSSSFTATGSLLLSPLSQPDSLFSLSAPTVAQEVAQEVAGGQGGEGWGLSSCSMDTSGGGGEEEDGDGSGDRESAATMSYGDDVTTKEGDCDFSYRSSVESRWSTANTPTATQTFGNIGHGNISGLPPLGGGHSSVYSSVSNSSAYGSASYCSSGSRSGEVSPNNNTTAAQRKQQQTQQEQLQQQYHQENLQYQYQQQQRLDATNMHNVHCSVDSSSGGGYSETSKTSNCTSTLYNSSSNGNGNGNATGRNNIVDNHDGSSSSNDGCSSPQHQQNSNSRTKSPISNFTGYHTRSQSFGKSSVNYAV